MAPDNVLISLVVPCYKVASYLPTFLASLDKQTSNFNDFEVVFVVDGCPESSETIIRKWQKQTACKSTLIVTKNQGVSAARTLGLQNSKGTWITFPDPDDELSDDYLSKVEPRLVADVMFDLVVTKLVKCDADITTQYRHPLDYRYKYGSRALSLQEEPSFLQLAVHTAFFQREILTRNSIEFDSALKVFEDGKFVGQYLLHTDQQRIFVETEALYFYKVRDDGSSALQTSHSDFVQRYITNLSKAHYTLLSSGFKAGEAPAWLQMMVLYDLFWLFSAATRLRDPIHGSPEVELNQLRIRLREVFPLFSKQVLLDFNIVRVLPEIRAYWLILNQQKTEKWVRKYRVEEQNGLAEYRYLTAEASDEIIIVDGKIRHPQFAKSRSITFFGEVIAYERIVWVEQGEHTNFYNSSSSTQEHFVLVGRPMTDRDWSRHYGWWALSNIRAGSVIPRPTQNKFRTKLQRLSKQINRFSKHAIARSHIPRRVFKDSWILMDRDTQAKDNAEALYRHIRTYHASINAWFVLNRKSHDYKRLKREGFKVIPYGSFKHFAAMKNAKHLLSSQVDEYVVRPFKELGLQKKWNYIFLQHGVTYNSLHRWLNAKDIQLLVTATEPEARSFSENLSPYIFSDKEILLSGFPRHDQLYNQLKNNPRKNVFLIMPTWRQYLMDETGRQGNERSVNEIFANSSYIKEWSNFLNHPRFRELSAKHGLEVVLLAHPNLEPHLEFMNIPTWISVSSYRENFQKLLVASKLVMTDYSSQAFEGAFCKAPCLYFQFDKEQFFSGTHIGSPGYFDFERDGFGPVTFTANEAVQGLASLLEDETVFDLYIERVNKLYAHWDSGASERIVKAVQTTLR